MRSLSQEKKFKDKCDECGKFDFLRGYNNKCLCESCRKKYEMPTKGKQLSIFEMEVAKNDMVRN